MKGAALGNRRFSGKVCRSIPVLLVCVIIVCLLLNYYGKGKSASRSVFAMDTYMELTAYGADSEEALGRAVVEIQRIDGLLSTGIAESEVSRLNAEKEGALSEDLGYLLERSMEINEMSGGAFDITIYPVMEAWGFAGGEFRVPDDEELSKLLAYVDMSSLKYSRESGRLEMPRQVELDFGGIGKGYTAQCIADILSEYDIGGAMLNLGGNVQIYGSKPDGSEWKIAVKSPDGALPYLGILSFEGLSGGAGGSRAVVTSGGYERYFEKDGKIYHHIIDPRTGKPADSGLDSVTVVCGDGTLADGLSTAIFVMGYDRAVELWRGHKGEFELVLFDDQGKLYVTEGLEGSFVSEIEYEIIY